MDVPNSTNYNLAMEPDDILTYANQTNLSSICYSWGRVLSSGVFLQSNPLEFSYSLLLLQMTLATATILSISRILKVIGQPLYVSQFLGGLMLGPSLFGRIFKNYLDVVFPMRGFMLLDVLATFAFMFAFFLIGVQVDPCSIKNINRQTFFIGVCTITLPIILSTTCAVFLGGFVDGEEAKKLLVVAQAESVLSFPVIAYFLGELRILNSEFGRVALSSSMVSSLCSFCLITTSVVLHQSEGEKMKILQTTCLSIVFAVVILLIRPAFMWMIRRTAVGNPLNEAYTIVMFIGVMISGVCGHAMGLHIHFGSFMLGLILPAGPPVGTTVMERLYPICTWMFMPLYFVKTGLTINIFSVQLKHCLIVQCIAFISSFGKFMGAFLVSLLSGFPIRDAVCLGLVMNFQGILELGLFKLMKKNKVIDNMDYTVMCIYMVLVTGVVTPIIRVLYNPSRRYVVYKKRTVMHSPPDAELRIVVCVHDQESVPASINVLEALNPKKQSPLIVYMLHLVELAGRANPILINHKFTKLPSSSEASSSESVVKAFKYFEESNHGVVTVFPFTAISPVETMHDDLCSIALHRRASLVIVPFYKRFHADGIMESTKMSIKFTNRNVLEKAPCSTAILVDRGLLKMSRSIFESWYEYNVAVLFLGGPDDREALVLGIRMAGHPCVHLTVVQLLKNSDDDDDDDGDGDDDNDTDDEVVNMLWTSMEENYRISYREEKVRDGSGTVAVIRSMENNYELVIVGRNHDNESPFVSGLTVWNEHMELGVIGDVLASSNFMGSTTILVVQQHNRVQTEKQTNNLRYSSKRSHVDDESKDTLIS